MVADVSYALRAALLGLAADRWRFYFAVFLCVLSSLVELIGVGTLYPFLSLLTKPEIVQSNPFLLWAYEYGGFTSIGNFMLWCGWSALAAFFLANLLLFFKNAYIIQFCVGQTARVSIRLLRSYLHKSMLFHINSNSSVLSKNVIEQSDQFTMGVLLSVMTLLGDGLILVVLVGLILSVDFEAGLLVTSVLGTFLGVTLVMTRSRIQQLGKRNDDANGARFSFCITALQSIKEIKAAGKEEFFARLYRVHSEEMARCFAQVSIVQLLPQYIIQFAAVGTVIGMALYYIAVGADLATIVPTLMLYAVAGYRLMPSVNKMAIALTQIRQFRPAIDNIVRVLEDVQGEELCCREDPNRNVPYQGIEFRRVGFAYPGSEGLVFTDLTLHLEGNSSICVVGPSGSGKTTLVDLLLGLLEPTAGEILVHGVSRTTMRDQEWREMFGYVPQSVYILDGTIAENIAFGVAAEQVDEDRLRQVVRQCHLEDFVDAKAEGLWTQVGERGSRLSGGQRQRIGIARALYRNPSIIILDESTSSLDGISERAIIDTLSELKKCKTVISIAHRDSLIKHSDRVIVIDHGQVVGDGSYGELLVSSPIFASLVSELKPAMP